MHKLQVLLAAIVLIANTLDIAAHPQCLDYFPPFASSRPNGLCKETSKYGCCSSTKEGYLLQVHRYARRTRIRLGAHAICDEIVREILCAECHPYAAHIYDAEAPKKTKSRFSKPTERFPGLCYGFCKKAFRACRSVILALPWKLEFRTFLVKSSAKDICEWAIPQDKHYCYPKVKKIAEVKYMNKAVGEKIITMCVQPVVHGLHNPLAAVHANDGSHRVFIGEQRGIVHVIDASGKKSEKPFLNVTRLILNSGQAWDERGFLGLVFHPKYAKNGRFFVYYSVANKGNISAKEILNSIILRRNQVD